MGIEHFLAHGGDVAAKFAQIARRAQDVDTDFFKGLADFGIARRESRPGQGLVFPHPGRFQLVFAKGLD